MARIEERVTTLEEDYMDLAKAIVPTRKVIEGLLQRGDNHSKHPDQPDATTAAYKSPPRYTPPDRPKDQIEDPLSMLMVRVAAVEDYLGKLFEERR